MARANVYDNGKIKKNNKSKLIAIISTISALVITGIVLLGCWLGGVFDKAEDYIYFNEYANKKVSFTDLNTILGKDEKEEKNTFVFVYDNSTFDAKIDENDNDYDQDDENIKNQFINLINAVKDKKTGPENSFNIYIVDSSAEGNDPILNNEGFGNIKEGSALLYFYRGVYYKATPEELENQFKEDSENKKHVYTLSAANDKKQVSGALKEATEFVKKIYNFE